MKYITSSINIPAAFFSAVILESDLKSLENRQQTQGDKQERSIDKFQSDVHRSRLPEIFPLW